MSPVRVNNFSEVNCVKPCAGSLRIFAPVLVFKKCFMR